MGYKLKKLSDLEIIELTVSGTLNQDTRKESYSKALCELNTSGFSKLLIDVTSSKVSPDYTSGNSFDLINHMGSLETKNHTKIAFLSTHLEDAHKSFVKFARTIGKAYIKHFKNRDKAIIWLGEE
jgi:hypothetical protein